MRSRRCSLAIPLLPLVAALLAGLGGKLIGRAGAAAVTIGAVARLLRAVVPRAQAAAASSTCRPSTARSTPGWSATGVRMQVGFLIDHLTALMMVVVTFVSLCVHVYTIGYMSDDPGYQRFFAYICLFTFSMLMLVMANNFMQLFFGWEAVGVVSYLLIGFWYTRPSAIFAEPQGVPGQSHRRLRLRARHRRRARTTPARSTISDAFAARADDRRARA